MIKFLRHLFKKRVHKNNTHGDVRVGSNWFYHGSVPDPKHPDYEFQKQICHEVINDLVKYGLLHTHCTTWQISRDVHIPSLRYYLCCSHPEHKFRLHCKRRWFKEKMDVTIYIDYVKPFPVRSKLFHKERIL